MVRCRPILRDLIKIAQSFSALVARIGSIVRQVCREPGELWSMRLELPISVRKR